MDSDKLIEQLIDHEGERLKPYTDTVGKLTIGVGRNLTDVGISQGESRFLLSNDISKVVKQLDEQLPWWGSMTEVRQRVLADMCFNLGWGRLMEFRGTLKAMKAGDYSGAAEGMRNSLWAKQVGRRAETLAAMMERG